MALNLSGYLRSVTPEQLAAHVARIDDEGYTIVEDAIEPELLDEVQEELRRLEVDLGIVPASNDFEGSATVRIYNLLVHGKAFERIPVHPNVLPVVEGVLDPGCLISSLSSIAICAGETPQPIHADDQLMPIPKPHPPTVCNTMWAITDFTEANGATRIIPGRGSVLIWHGSLWHGGGANTTDERRVGIAMNYCAGYVRQQENQQLGIPRHIAAGFDERLQRLCGYGVYFGLIGHIDKRDPIELLRGEGAMSMVWDQA
jgi:ectoine hydroxylase-related dioxygenase (phytanoyl-CoA dioxygenase family)